MENSLNCFQFKKMSVDFFTSDLNDMHTDALRNHFNQCSACQELSAHYQIIQSILKNHPQAALPPTLKAAPFSAALPKLPSGSVSSSRWERSPWYMRILIQTSLIVFCVTALVSSTPKLREIYETQIERNLHDLQETPSLHEDSTLADQKVLMESSYNSNHAELESTEDSLDGEDDFASTSKSGHSQLWRFTLKTVSPDELRVDILKLLSKFDLTPKSSGLSGIQVPGGIEFNFLLASEQISSLKNELQRLAPPDSTFTSTSTGQTQSPGSESFTWYKVHSKKKLPDGKAQVIIWISQPH